MEPVCDGSGVEAYYYYKGRKLLLCGTDEPHVHCECGEPMIGGLLADRCYDCNKRKAGLPLHKKRTARESREHISGITLKNLQRRSSDQ